MHSLEQGCFINVFAGGDHSFALLDKDNPKRESVGTRKTEILLASETVITAGDTAKKLIQYDEQLLDDDDLLIMDNEEPLLL